MSPRQTYLFELGAFKVSAKGLYVEGAVTVDEWAEAGARLARARGATQWAIGDWLLFGEDKYEDGPYEAAAEATGLKRGTLMNLKSVAKAFPKNKRTSAPWSHHALVAGFEESVRDELLATAVRERESWESLRARARELRIRQRALMQTFPEGTFGLILAAPPWMGLADENPIHAQTNEQLEALSPQVQRIAAPHCLLYLWAPTVRVVRGEANSLVRAWGFHAQDAHVWVKDTAGHGVYLRERHEHLIVATRGDVVPPTEDLRPDSVIDEPRLSDLWRKPDEVYDTLERIYPGVPKVELFADEAHDAGWVAWGRRLNEATVEERTARRGRRPVQVREETAEQAIA